MGLLNIIQCIVILHLCTFVTSAVVPSPDIIVPALSFPSEIQTLSTSINLTSFSSSNALPPDPFIYPVPNRSVTVQFSNYRRGIPKSTFGDCLASALGEMYPWLQDHPNAPIGQTQLRYTCGHTMRIEFVLIPDPQMTWEMWLYTLTGIKDFLKTYQYVELRFQAWESGAEVGQGRISRI